jgi:hypothetical protein
MMNLCMVIEVIQKRIPATTMVIIPGTHPKTLRDATVRVLKIEFATSTNSRERPCLSHNGQADLVSSEQPRSLLP